MAFHRTLAADCNCSNPGPVYRHGPRLAAPLAMAISAMILLCSPVAFAQNINLLPEGQTLITLSVTERAKVQQDLLVASLRIEEDDRDQQALQDRINTRMAQALEIARDSDNLEVSTGFYHVYQYDTPPQGGRTQQIWRGTQSITIEGTDTGAVLALSGELQALGFVMNQLSYQLSNARADEVRDGLLETAVARATANVERAGQALGKADVDIAVLDVENSMGYETMMMRTGSTAVGADMAGPSAEAGETEVTLTVRVQAVAK